MPRTAIVLTLADTRFFQHTLTSRIRERLELRTGGLARKRGKTSSHRTRGLNTNIPMTILVRSQCNHVRIPFFGQPVRRP